MTPFHELVQAGAPRALAWILNEDVAQEIALVDVEFPWMSLDERAAKVRERCATLRHEILDSPRVLSARRTRLIAEGKPVAPHSLETKEAALAALRKRPSIAAVAREHGVSRFALSAWAKAAKIKLPSPAARMAAGAAKGGAIRWGDTSARRAKIVSMRAKGMTWRAIATKLKCSTATVHSALRGA